MYYDNFFFQAFSVLCNLGPWAVGLWVHCTQLPIVFATVKDVDDYTYQLYIDMYS